MTKMKTTLRLFVAGALLLIASLMSCNPNHPAPGAPSSYKVKQIITTFPNNSGIDTTTFTYDVQGRVLKVQPYRNGGYEATYIFFADSMTIPDFRDPGEIAYCHLNADGTLASTHVATKCLSCPDYEDEYVHYSYASGFMTEMTVTTSTKTFAYRFNWTDSCLMSLTADSIAGENCSFTYYPNTVEYRDNGQENLWRSHAPSGALPVAYFLFGSVLGQHSKQLLKTYTQNGLTDTYTYTFDQYSRVATQTATNIYGSTIQQFVYY